MRYQSVVQWICVGMVLTAIFCLTLLSDRGFGQLIFVGACAGFLCGAGAAYRAEAMERHSINTRLKLTLSWPQVVLITGSCIGAVLIAPHIAGLPNLMTAYSTSGYAFGALVGSIGMKLVPGQERSTNT